jgi:hypothetical protein
LLNLIFKLIYIFLSSFNLILIKDDMISDSFNFSSNFLRFSFYLDYILFLVIYGLLGFVELVNHWIELAFQVFFTTPELFSSLPHFFFMTLKVLLSLYLLNSLSLQFFFLFWQNSIVFKIFFH